MNRARRAARTRAMQRRRKVGRRVQRVLRQLEATVVQGFQALAPLFDALTQGVQALVDAIPPEVWAAVQALEDEDELAVAP